MGIWNRGKAWCKAKVVAAYETACDVVEKGKDFAKSTGGKALAMGAAVGAVFGLGGAAQAADVVIPTSPLNVTGLATAAFTVFGDTITTVFPYILALCGIYLAIRLIKHISSGSTGN